MTEDELNSKAHLEDVLTDLIRATYFIRLPDVLDQLQIVNQDVCLGHYEYGFIELDLNPFTECVFGKLLARRTSGVKPSKVTEEWRIVSGKNYRIFGDLYLQKLHPYDLPHFSDDDQFFRTLETRYNYFGINDEDIEYRRQMRKIHFMDPLSSLRKSIVTFYRSQEFRNMVAADLRVCGGSRNA